LSATGSRNGVKRGLFCLGGEATDAALSA